MKGKSNQVVYKPYTPNQLSLFPQNMADLIEAHHPMWVVNSVIDQLDIDLLVQAYPGGGASTYHPRMMLKVLVYSYLNNIYSSRKIEAGLKENIHLMYLSGMQKPDHNTINRFRSERLKDSLEDIFKEVVLLLVERGHLSLQEVYTDGTTLESASGRYSFVWGKSVEKNKAKLHQQIAELWAYTQSLAAEELMEEQMPDPEKVKPKVIQESIEKIHSTLKKKRQEGVDIDEKKLAKATRLKREYSQRIQNYQKKEAILASSSEPRNSYSKTDPDATFMYLKDNVLKQGHLKPAYNWQVSTSKQYIVHYSIHQSPGDTVTLKPHLEGFRKQYGKMPEKITTDAGYGSEENYQYLAENQIEAFVKYGYYDKEKSTKFQQDISKAENLTYAEEQDIFYCPSGQVMNRIKTEKKANKSGFVQELAYYQAQNCEACPLRKKCHKSQSERIIQVNHPLRAYKAQAKQRLDSEEGIKKRKQRNADVEATFGIIKANQQFKRLRLRGKEKVMVEVGLKAIAHKLKKVANAQAA